MPTPSAPPNVSIANEVLRLHADAIRFLAGELEPEKFRALRVVQGIYEQRRGGSFMLRVRVAAGRVGLHQLHGLAKLAVEHAVVRLHVTTRQDIQLHDLSLQTALQIQAGLLNLGLTSYGSGGNTLRNVAADPLSGLNSDEAFDVHPYALFVAAKYLGPDKHPGLPRKFKIAFSASAADRAGACVADLGFIAERRGTSRGFRVLVGGGLGIGPATAIELLPWVETSAIGQVTEGLIQLFATHGDRTNRHKARLRHLRKRLGDAEFLRLCHEFIGNVSARAAIEPEQVSTEVADELPTIATPLPTTLRGLVGVAPEREQGRFSVRLAPLYGDLTPSALLVLAEAAAEFCAPVARIGLEQELWVTGVGGSAVEPLLARLRGQGLGTPDERSQPVIACSGAATCKLGILRSRDAANAIERQLTRDGIAWHHEPIRISGCPNACGRHLVAQLGFEGRTKRVGARLLPNYAVFFGGMQGAEDAKLASNIGTLPAKRLPEFIVAVERLVEAASITVEERRHLVTATVDAFARLPNPVPEDWFLDWGSNSPPEPSQRC